MTLQIWCRKCKQALHGTLDNCIIYIEPHTCQQEEEKGGYLHVSGEEESPEDELPELDWIIDDLSQMTDSHRITLTRRYINTQLGPRVRKMWLMLSELNPEDRAWAEQQRKEKR